MLTLTIFFIENHSDEIAFLEYKAFHPTKMFLPFILKGYDLLFNCGLFKVHNIRDLLRVENLANYQLELMGSVPPDLEQVIKYFVANPQTELNI